MDMNAKINIGEVLPLIVCLNHTYMNGQRKLIRIEREIPTSDIHFEHGFRFYDQDNTPYTADGKATPDGAPVSLDLVVDLGDHVVEATSTVEIVTDEPGMFRRLWGSMKRHPVKSAVGIAAVGGAGAYGGYNYHQTGSVLPNRDLEDVAEAVAAFLNR